jgi:hypothetical protein
LSTPPWPAAPRSSAASKSLRAEGVKILLGPGGFQPHPPRTGGALIDSYPWHLGLDEAERLLDPAAQKP